MKFKTNLHTLGSGMRVAVTKTPNYYTAKFRLSVMVGAEDETAPNGVAHLIEHTMFKGTDKLSQEEISAKFNSLSADIDASTSSEFTNYKVEFPKRNLKPVLELVSHILHDSQFDETLMNKEKQVIVEEISMHEDNPEQLAFDKLVKEMYKDNGIGNEIAGTRENLLKTTKPKIYKFYLEHYNPKNFLVSVIGDFDEEEVVNLVDEYFNKPFLNRTTHQKTKNWSKPSKIKPMSLRLNKQINQSNILMGFRTLPFADMDRLSVGLINFILGGSMNSRLFIKVRNDLSLCYSIFSFDMNYSKNGFVGISLATSPLHEKQAIDAVNAEIEKIHEFGVTDEEFEIAKNLTLDKYLMYQDVPHVGLTYLAYTGLLLDENDIIEKIKKITKEEALEKFKKYIKPDKEFCVVVSPSNS